MRELITVVIATLLCCSPLMAEGDQYETEDLLEMSLEDILNIQVESTTKTKVSLRKAPGTVYSFSREDFQNFGIKTIDDIYWHIPSVQPYNYKKNNVVVLRGVIERFNNRNQHIVDGVVARNGYYNHEEFDDFIPLEWIDRYEMIVGPGSALYGANAFSGVSSLSLLGFADQRKLHVGVTAELDPSLPQVTATYQDKNVAVGLTGASGDVPHPQYNITGEDFNQISEYKMYHGFLKFNLGGKGSLFARYGLQEKPYINNKDDKKVYLDKSPLIFGGEYSQGDADLNGVFGFKANHTIQKFAERNFEDDTKETQDASFSNVDLTFNKNLGSTNLLLGASWQSEKADDIKTDDGSDMLQTPGVTQTNFAGFAQGIFDVADPMTITVGVRYDAFSEFDNRINGRAAVVYDVTDKSTVKLLAGTATRIPSLREWNKDLEGTSFVQPQLEPEGLNTYELSFNQLLGQVYFDVTLFYNSFTKMLLEQDTPVTADDPAGGSDEYFYNTDDKVSMSGVEFNAKFKQDKMMLLAGFSLINTDDGSGEDVHYIRGYKYSLSATYDVHKQHRLTVGAAGFDQPKMLDTKNSDCLPVNEVAGFDDPSGFVYLHAAVSGNINRNISYTVGMRNLADEKTYDPFYMSGKYRNIERRDKRIWASLGYSFDL